MFLKKNLAEFYQKLCSIQKQEIAQMSTNREEVKSRKYIHKIPSAIAKTDDVIHLYRLLRSTPRHFIKRKGKHALRI